MVPRPRRPPAGGHVDDDPGAAAADRAGLARVADPGGGPSARPGHAFLSPAPDHGALWRHGGGLAGALRSGDAGAAHPDHQWQHARDAGRTDDRRRSGRRDRDRKLDLPHAETAGPSVASAPARHCRGRSRHAPGRAAGGGAHRARKGGVPAALGGGAVCPHPRPRPARGTGPHRDRGRAGHHRERRAGAHRTTPPAAGRQLRAREQLLLHRPVEKPVAGPAAGLSGHARIAGRGGAEPASVGGMDGHAADGRDRAGLDRQRHRRCVAGGAADRTRGPQPAGAAASGQSQPRLSARAASLAAFAAGHERTGAAGAGAEPRSGAGPGGRVCHPRIATGAAALPWRPAIARP